jgi:hypothetical protein
MLDLSEGVNEIILIFRDSQTDYSRGTWLSPTNR